MHRQQVRTFVFSVAHRAIFPDTTMATTTTSSSLSCRTSGHHAILPRAFNCNNNNNNFVFCRQAHLTSLSLPQTSKLARQQQHQQNFQRDPDRPALEVVFPRLENKKWYLRMFGFYSKESRISRQASLLVAIARDQAENPDFFKSLGISQTFQTKFMVAGLHIWMVWHRTRSEDADGQTLGAALFELFWDSVTKDITTAGVSYMQVNKQLTELQYMFFGNARRLDKSLHDNQSDEFKQALLKNILLGQSNEAALESLFTYVMQAMYALELLDSDALMNGYFVWGLPKPVPIPNAISSSALSPQQLVSSTPSTPN